MEVVRYTGERPSKYPKVALSFSSNGLITSALPNTGGEAGDLQEVELENLDNQPQLRHFTVSTVEMFSRAQREFKKSCPEPVSQKIVTELSMAYRGAILELVESFQQAAASSDLAMLYSHLDCVWHFCEIMFISSHPELPILPYYLDWIRVNFDDSETTLMRLIPELPELDSEGLNLLWSIIFKHVFHGRTKEAAKLLEFTNQEQSVVFGEQLALLTELLLKKPHFQPSVNSISEFTTSWQSWKTECENRLSKLAFCGSDKLTLLVQILVGSDDGFQEAKSHISTWYEYLSMILNYQYPLLRPASLKAYAQKGIDDYGDFSIVLSPLDKILLAAMDYDIVTVLKDMQTHWNHPWFPLHFSDLIFSGGIYSNVADARIDYKSVGPIRHDLVREYGIQLMQHPALWEIGVKYLEAIPNAMGLPVIAELLQRRKPTSVYEAEKIIRVAKKFEFNYENHRVCRELALQKFQEGQLQNSLLWSIRAEDAQMTATVVDKILQEGKVDIVPSLVELIPKFSACGDRLIFLNGFCEYTKFVQTSRFKESVELLCRLIEQNLIPKLVRSKLLILLLDTLSKNDVKIEPVEVSILMQFLHTKVGKEILGNDVFHRLNEKLMASRASEMLRQFKLSKNITRTATTAVTKV